MRSVQALFGYVLTCLRLTIFFTFKCGIP